ncbi:hypothetical protein H310_04400 [Aphanomyces invadans]|uniref:DUF7164 domain-containing protein n=1 Tax=Aphanomyces invadans TaxID=157072 RepID=A0A024UCR6_9STRA|nr:hypothetical protein H310_04400 [Aphanomyces invadans]ETW03995.1 hypothetical protein H310_04400 [Aphanomyces invadans]|eukprot:XP_008866951.1 hypothetical protein H310_04400 [Aphanomyces invadans]
MSREDVFVRQFRWFRRSWHEMHKTEPPNFRTDVVVVSNGIIKDLRGLGCTTKPRASRDAPNRCILVQDYELLYSKDTFDYRFGDSINIVAKSTPVLDAYDWLLRTDIDVFLTPAFSSWRPKTMVVGYGGYESETSVQRLGRIAKDLNLNVAGMHSVGSTWYGPTKLIQECANLTVFMMKYLHQNEFTAEEKSPEYGIKGWPEWHYGVLTLYAGHIAINHCAFGDLAVRDENMLDFPTASDGDVAYHAHLHTWQNAKRFSKFVFDQGGYANETLDKLNLHQVSDYAMYMALDSQETPEPTMVPISYPPDTPHGKVLIRAIVVHLPSANNTNYNDNQLVSHFQTLHQSWKDMLRSEPTLWRTDLVVVTDRPTMPELTALKCTDMYRTTTSYKSFCVQVSATTQSTLTKLSVDGNSTSWPGYDLANALHAVQLDLPQLKSYQWLLRTDLNTLVTPGLSTWHPTTAVFGPANSHEPKADQDLVKGISTELKLDHLALPNVGTTWYGPSTWVVECAKIGLQALLHLHQQNKTGSSSNAVAASVAINHCANKHLDGASAVLNDTMLDIPTTSSDSPNVHAHLRAVMTNDAPVFSAAAFAAGTYADVELESLHPGETIHDYAMAMALKSHGGFTPTSVPPPVHSRRLALPDNAANEHARRLRRG